MAQKLLIPATSTSANAVVLFSRSPLLPHYKLELEYILQGEKKPLSDHSCTPKAPSEPYRKGSSAPAIITDAKAVRPPCSSSDRLRSNKQHTDVGSFQQSLKETQDPRQKYAQLPAGPEGRALLPGAGEIPMLTGGPRTQGWTAPQPQGHPRHGTHLLFRWHRGLGCLAWETACFPAPALCNKY